MSSSVLPMFSSKSFIVSGLTFRSLIHLEFSFVYGVREYSNFILLHVAVQFSQHRLLKGLSFLHCIFLPPLPKIRWPYVHRFISELSILFHWSILLFLCQYHIVLITVGLLYSLQLGSLIPPAPFFFLKIALGLPWWRSGWESAWQCSGQGFDPWSWKIPHASEQLSPCATTTQPVL